MNIAELLLPMSESSRPASSSTNLVKKYPCTWPDCNKSFGRPSDATRHYRIHTNDRRFVCDIPFCCKRFIQRSALTVHLRTHSGERPHQCQFAGCSKSFSDSSSLARHRRIHTGNRPYKCSICNKSYTKKYLLVYHTQRHRDEQQPMVDDGGFGATTATSYYAYPYQYSKPSPVSPSSTLYSSTDPAASPSSSPSSMISSLSSFSFPPSPFSV
ncbi:hypothetical protein [Absidia glauca]|uniref:C2H2-type domain-containing protein n=1 Tax=Absidia glauca TaxID=4829 RepID=A0A168PD32_ABSGL|nr:hypothetical protein [Absidia glauca]